MRHRRRERHGPRRGGLGRPNDRWRRDWPRLCSRSSIVPVVRDGEVWTLRRRSDDQTVADLAITGGDFPWLNARVEPREGFAEILPLFAEELTRLDRIDDEAGSWEEAYDALRAAVSLHYPGGGEVPEFLLHVDGDEAWWRWSDEPFVEDV